MRKITVIIMIMAVSLLFLSADEKQVMQKAGELVDAEKFEDALGIIEAGIAEFGKTRGLLNWKYYLLFELGHFDRALETALEKETLAERKSPWDCMDIAQALLEADKHPEALDWIEEAADRGFIGYQMLQENDEFEDLQENDRFEAVVSGIKEAIGIGRPVKDFSIPLLGGSEFVLSGQKGKVVLIDFWATWCGPCIREMPNLKSLYDEYGDKGLEIIGISLDQDQQALDDYLAEEALTWKISFSGQAWEDETARLYGVNSIPSYWLVDKQGILRHFGLRGEALRQAVAELIEE